MINLTTSQLFLMQITYTFIDINSRFFKITFHIVWICCSVHMRNVELMLEWNVKVFFWFLYWNHKLCVGATGGQYLATAFPLAIADPLGVHKNAGKTEKNHSVILVQPIKIRWQLAEISKSLHTARTLSSIFFLPKWGRVKKKTSKNDCKVNIGNGVNENPANREPIIWNRFHLNGIQKRIWWL